jgi:acyl-CoA synthetase (AMP-forming)/AMP-acid ligase II
MNIAEYITKNAREFPDKKAVVFPVDKYIYEHYTFSNFESKCNQYANTLKDLGVKKGSKVLLFVKPSLDFSVITFSLFKMGAVPVLMDPGMGIKNLLSSVEQCRPDVLIAEPIIHIIRRFFKKTFSSIKLNITTGNMSFSKTKCLFKLAKTASDKFKIEKTADEDMAAILFTSGGTGRPKGVVYTHGIFNAQTMKLKEMYHLTPLEVDLPGFPLFSLFTIALGMTSCIPDMNPSKPAKADPAKLIKNILDNEVTFAAGSPAIWEKVAEYCEQKVIKLPSIKYLVMFGAPVKNDIHKKFKKILLNGTTYTPYGATECLPVSNISGVEVLTDTAKLTEKGKGTCVGLPAPGVTIKIIKSTDTAFQNISEVEECKTGEVGEVIIQSDTVTPKYYEMNNETELAKISDDKGLWHRMGDMGYLDDKGRLWFCGRKSHKVALENETLYTIPVETIFNKHDEVKRTALVRLKTNKGYEPVIIVERNDHKTGLKEEQFSQFKKELLKLGEQTKESKKIKDFMLYKDFPVDGRHNIKIDRKALQSWAQRGHK